MLTTKLSILSSKSNKSSIVWRQIRHINSNIGVIGIPFWYGQSRLGTNLAPEILRSKGLIDKLSAQFGQNRVIDFGNISLEIDSNEISKNQWKNPNEFNLWKLSEKSSNFIENLIKNDYIPLILGGDHSIAVGSVMGTKQALINMGNSDGDDLSLIWIDAHADANTVQSSLSGNLHGMPMSFLVKTTEQHQKNQQHQIKPCINAKNIVYIGLRDVEIQELHLLKELNIAYFSMKDVDNLGINEVIARSLDHIDPLGKNHLHISFDVDSLDPMIIPSTGTPVMGGLTFRETLQIGEYINNTGRMIAMDLVEFNPNIGTEQMIDQSAKTIIEIIMAFFGKSRLG